MPHTIRHEVAGLVRPEGVVIPFGRWVALVAFALGAWLLYAASLRRGKFSARAIAQKPKLMAKRGRE